MWQILGREGYVSSPQKTLPKKGWKFWQYAILRI